MIKHIVRWRLKDFTDGADKMENARRPKSRLAALTSQIPGLLHIEAGLDFERGYKSLQAVRSERRMIDYEV